MVNIVSDYVELHARSAFSFLEGAAIPEDLAGACARFGMPAMAIVDRNGVALTFENTGYGLLGGAAGAEWARIASGAGLLVGALLLLAGKRRAGLVAAAAGTTLAVLDQQETGKELWNALPIYIDKAQGVLGKVDATVSEVAAQRERLQKILSR